VSARPGAVTADLPDVNARTNPFPVVQHHLDQAHWLSLYAVPVPGHPEAAWLTGDGRDYFGIDGGYGLDVASRLHGFDACLMPPRTGGPRVRQAVGKAMGELSGRFLFGPEDLAWTPGREPPIRMYDPWRSQAFAMVDVDVRCGDGNDGFRGYGVGRTWPVSAGGQPVVLAGGVGDVTEGRGKLRGLEGTFVLNGELHHLGFEGSVTCRMIDPEGRLAARGEPPGTTQAPGVSPRSTFVVMRGEKRGPDVRTEYGPPPGPGLVSLITPAQMRAVDLRTFAPAREGVCSRMETGQVVAELMANVSLDILAPPGTSERPNTFTTHNRYRFVAEGGLDGEIGEAGEIGEIEVEVPLGRSFGLRFPSLPSQPAMRYGGVGPVVVGRGRLAGAVGLIGVNSAIGVAPHALSMLNVLQIVDPDGRFRVGTRSRAHDA